MGSNINKGDFMLNSPEPIKKNNVQPRLTSISPNTTSEEELIAQWYKDPSKFKSFPVLKEVNHHYAGLANGPVNLGMPQESQVVPPTPQETLEAKDTTDTSWKPNYGFTGFSKFNDDREFKDLLSNLKSTGVKVNSHSFNGGRLTSVQLDLGGQTISLGPAAGATDRGQAEVRIDKDHTMAAGETLNLGNKKITWDGVNLEIDSIFSTDKSSTKFSVISGKSFTDSKGIRWTPQAISFGVNADNSPLQTGVIGENIPNWFNAKPANEKQTNNKVKPNLTPKGNLEDFPIIDSSKPNRKSNSSKNNNKK